MAATIQLGLKNDIPIENFQRENHPTQIGWEIFFE
jgi:hypothetical protein